jgi:hypothetical protein
MVDPFTPKQILPFNLIMATKSRPKREFPGPESVSQVSRGKNVSENRHTVLVHKNSRSATCEGHEVASHFSLTVQALRVFRTPGVG